MKGMKEIIIHKRLRLAGLNQEGPAGLEMFWVGDGVGGIYRILKLWI